MYYDIVFISYSTTSAHLSNLSFLWMCLSRKRFIFIYLANPSNSLSVMTQDVMK